MEGKPWLLLMTVTVVAGCGETPAEQATSECRLAPTPSLAVGGSDPSAHPFGSVVDATLLDDGRIAVVDRRARSVSLFSDSGELIRTIGREGEGPGEFLDPIAIDHRGDTVAIWDWRQARITEVDLRNDQVETIPVRDLLNPTHHLGYHQEGFILGSVWAGGSPPTGVAPDTLRVLAFHPGTSTVDTLARFTESMTGWVDYASRFAGSPTFSPRGSFTTTSSGVYWSTGDSAVIYGLVGDDTVRLVWDWPERVVSADEFERYRRTRLEQASGSFRDLVEKQFEVMPVAEVFPVALDVMPDMDGGVWIEVYPVPSDSLSTWLRVTQEGLVCHLRLPEAFEITEGGADWILAYDEDDLGVQTVYVWELEGAS